MVCQPGTSRMSTMPFGMLAHLLEHSPAWVLFMRGSSACRGLMESPPITGQHGEKTSSAQD